LNLTNPNSSYRTNKQNFPPNNRTDGFTIIESIVALAVLSASMIAVFGALRTCSAAALHSRMLTKAVLVAESCLVNTAIEENFAFSTTNGKTGRFNWQVKLIPTSLDNLAAVEVNVTWLEQQVKKQYGLVSLLKMKSFTQSN